MQPGRMISFLGEAVSRLTGARTSNIDSRATEVRGLNTAKTTSSSFMDEWTGNQESSSAVSRPTVLPASQPSLSPSSSKPPSLPSASSLKRKVGISPEDAPKKRVRFNEEPIAPRKRTGENNTSSMQEKARLAAAAAKIRQHPPSTSGLSDFEKMHTETAQSRLSEAEKKTEVEPVPQSVSEPRKATPMYIRTRKIRPWRPSESAMQKIIQAKVRAAKKVKGERAAQICGRNLRDSALPAPRYVKFTGNEICLMQERKHRHVFCLGRQQLLAYL